MKKNQKPSAVDDTNQIYEKMPAHHISCHIKNQYINIIYILMSAPALNSNAMA